MDTGNTSGVFTPETRVTHNTCNKNFKFNLEISCCRILPYVKYTRHLLQSEYGTPVGRIPLGAASYTGTPTQGMPTGSEID